MGAAESPGRTTVDALRAPDADQTKFTRRQKADGRDSQAISSHQSARAAARFCLKISLLRFQRQLAKYSLLIIDELGFVPLSKTGAELLFEVFSQRYERGSTLLTSNLPFDEWTEVFASERLTGALLDRLTHHVHILEMNGESFRLNQSRKRRKSPKST